MNNAKADDNFLYYNRIMDLKSIQKSIIQTADTQLDQTASAEEVKSAGLVDVSDAVEIAGPAQQELFSTDFQTFDLQEHYSAVHMQEGRVQTDADWNEQQQLSGVRMQQGNVQTDNDWNDPEHNSASLEDGIVVQFEKGETRSPFITGDLWDFAERPPEEQTETSDDSTSDSSDP
jgi:hypothetical protein